jgi:two-component system sensor histidine kinase PilS (NtrC family)
VTPGRAFPQEQGRLGQRLRWLIAIRLLVITSVLLPYVVLVLFAQGEDAPLDAGLSFAYLLAGATYAASVLYALLLRLLPDHPTAQAYLQFAGDLVLVTGLVYSFGGAASPFSIFYLIVVIVASILLSRRGALTIATFSASLFSAVALGLFYGWLPRPLFASGEEINGARLLYSLATHIFGSYAVALMTGRLAQSVTRAERELSEKQEILAELQVAYRDVIESIPSGLLTTDADGRVTSINPAGQEILAKGNAEVLGQPVTSIGLFDASQWLPLERAAAEGRSSARRELTLPSPGGTRTIGYSTSLLNRADGAPGGRIVIFQDLSEWKKLQEELATRDRMAAVGKLAAGLAHEIGNPLAAISGSVQMLSNSLAGLPKESKLLEILLKESQRLDRTIKRFLQFARPTEGSKMRFDIGSLLEEHVELLRNSAEVSPQHSLVTDLEFHSQMVVADPDQVSQVFWNLARNSLRAMPEGGTLTIRGRVVESVYRIEVSDTGRGMTEKERANLFHPFQSFFDGGTGIGMAIVYQIVEDHGGRLGVASELGAGTSITVDLPLAPAAAPSRAVEA